MGPRADGAQPGQPVHVFGHERDVGASPAARVESLQSTEAQVLTPLVVQVEEGLVTLGRGHRRVAFGELDPGARVGQVPLDDHPHGGLCTLELLR